jgi:hypothetical protein
MYAAVGAFERGLSAFDAAGIVMSQRVLIDLANGEADAEGLAPEAAEEKRLEARRRANANELERQRRERMTPAQLVVMMAAEWQMKEAAHAKRGHVAPKALTSAAHRRVHRVARRRASRLGRPHATTAACATRGSPTSESPGSPCSPSGSEDPPRPRARRERGEAVVA